MTLNGLKTILEAQLCSKMPVTDITKGMAKSKGKMIEKGRKMKVRFNLNKLFYLIFQLAEKSKNGLKIIRDMCPRLGPIPVAHSSQAILGIGQEKVIGTRRKMGTMEWDIEEESMERGGMRRKNIGENMNYEKY
jgi:hypothetical protein